MLFAWRSSSRSRRTRRPSDVGSDQAKVLPVRLRHLLRKLPPYGDRLLTFPFHELDVAAVGEGGGAAAGDLAGLADEEVYGDAFGLVAPDEATVGVVSPGAVLALPLE